MDFDRRILQIRKLAKIHDWREVEHKEEQFMIRFKKGYDAIVDVWYSKMTIGTIVTHPTKGRGQLFRRHADMEMLAEILKNPRVHTSEGYYRRRR